MRCLNLSFFSLLFYGLLWSHQALAQSESFKVPPLRAPVMDTAGMVGDGVEKRLNQALKALYTQGGSQIQVLTLPDLGGLSIEQASIQVVDEWKLGRAKEEKAALLLVSQAERDLRIEVAYGLEGELTDLESSRIIRESIVPLFRAGDTTAGILTGVFQIVSRTDPKFDFEKYFSGQPLRRKQESPLGGGFTFLVYVILFIVMMIVSRGNPLFLLLLLSSGGRGGYRGGGGFGGGGFGGGGGGWSGGGGGFGGGGASGSW